MYAKLFSSITDSTIWREPDHVRIVWITLLAMCDKHGEVAASVPGLADRARVPLEETVKALQVLAAPDEWSRSNEYEGRRIENIGGGWKLLNYEKYSKIRDEEERKAYMRNYMRKRRSKQDVNNVSNVNSSKPPLAHIDIYTDIKPLDGKRGDTIHSKKENPPSPSQNDFDERDQKLLAKAKQVVSKRAAANVGSGSFTEAEFMTAVCEEAGLTPQRVRKLEEMLKWR